MKVTPWQAASLYYDGSADVEDYVEIELSPEAGVPGKYKLYVHVNGVTVLRICKLNPGQLNTPMPLEWEKEKKE